MKEPIAIEEYREICRAFPHNYFILDIDVPKFTILDGSDQHIIGLNSSRDVLIGNPVLEMFPNNDESNFDGIDRLYQSFLDVVKTGQKQALMLRYDVRNPATNKFEFRYWSIENHPYFSNGKLKYILNSSSDITPLFKASGIKL